MRRAGILILIALIAVLAGGTYLAWRWRTSARFRSATPVLTLRVNHGRQIIVLAGTPLLFDVSLMEHADDPSMARVRLVRSDSKDALPWQPTRLGSVLTVGHIVDADGNPKPAVASAAVSPVAGQRSQLTLAVSPDAAKTTAPGTYWIQAVMDAQYWPPWRAHGRAVSAPVSVIVQSDAGVSDADRRAKERLLLSARFYLASRQPAAAGQAATALLALDAHDPTALTLLGDSLLDEGQPRDALRAYRSALAAVPVGYEEPTLIYDRIAEASRKLTTSASR